MAKRTSAKPPRQTVNATASAATADSVEHQVVVFAEQIGRIVGTMQARAEGWLDKKMLTEQISHVRDSATHLLERISGNGSKPTAQAQKASADPHGRSGGMVDAPGKRHRKPVPSARGVKSSDNRLAKMNTVNARRRQRPGQA